MASGWFLRSRAFGFFLIDLGDFALAEAMARRDVEAI